MHRQVRCCWPIPMRRSWTRFSVPSLALRPRSTSWPIRACGIALWDIADAASIEVITNAFERLPALYIADGHHLIRRGARAGVRSGEAANTRASPTNTFSPWRSRSGGDADPALQPAGEGSERPVEGGIPTPKSGNRRGWERSAAPVARRNTGEFGLYLAGEWYRLRVRPGIDAARRPSGSLGCQRARGTNSSRLCWASADQRRDSRIDFVGGIRGLAELAARVRQRRDGFARSRCFRRRMEDLMAVADARGDAPEIHLVRAEARRRASVSRTRLDEFSRYTSRCPQSAPRRALTPWPPTPSISFRCCVPTFLRRRSVGPASRSTTSSVDTTTRRACG